MKVYRLMFEIFITDSPKQDGFLTYMLYKTLSKEYAEMIAEELAENINVLFDYEKWRVFSVREFDIETEAIKDTEIINSYIKTIRDETLKEKATDR